MHLAQGNIYSLLLDIVSLTATRRPHRNLAQSVSGARQSRLSFVKVGRPANLIGA